MSVAAAEHGNLDIDRIRRLADEVLRAIPARLAVIVLLLVMLPQVVAGIALPQVIAAGVEDASLRPAIWAIEFVAFLIISSGFWLAQAAVVYAAGTQIEGEPESTGACLGAVFGNASALLVQGVIAFAWVGMMFLFLVIPGFMAMSGWLVGLPVHVLENGAPLAAFRRSERLTLGHRPTVFGLFFQIVVLVIGVSVAVKVFLSLLAPAVPFAAWLAGVILLPAIAAVGVAWGGVMLTAIYYELRLIKDGIGRQDVVAVFN